MRPFYGNKRRSLAVAIAAMLLALNFTASAVASDGFPHDIGCQDDVSSMVVLDSPRVIPADGTDPLSDTRDCHGISCQLYIPTTNLYQSSVQDENNLFPNSANQWANPDLISPFRPPRSIL